MPHHSFAAQLGIPALLEGLSKNAQSPEGAKSLADALDYHADKSPYDLDNIDQVDGGKILGHIFGNNTSGVADQLSARSGLTASQSNGLLAMLAPILMNMLGKEKKQMGLPTEDLSMLTGGLGKQLLGDADGKSILSHLTDLLDKNKDGSVIDDLKGMLGGRFHD